MNSNSFVAFPRERIVRAGMNELSTFQIKAKESMRQYLNSVVEDEIVAIHERFTMAGVEVGTEKFQIYFPVIAELLRECCYDLIDVEHPNKQNIENLVNGFYESSLDDSD